MLERRAQWLAEKLSGEFAIKVNWRWLQQRIAAAVAQDVAAVPVLSGYLRRLGVRCVVEAVAYSERNRALTKAAHDLGIPVVELQHGAGFGIVIKEPERHFPREFPAEIDLSASEKENFRLRQRHRIDLIGIFDNF